MISKILNILYYTMLVIAVGYLCYIIGVTIIHTFCDCLV
jgi:hypothetical protein